MNLNYIRQTFVMLPNEEAKFAFLIKVYEFCDINQSVIFVNVCPRPRPGNFNEPGFPMIWRPTHLCKKNDSFMCNYNRCGNNNMIVM